MLCRIEDQQIQAEAISYCLLAQFLKHGFLQRKFICFLTANKTEINYYTKTVWVIDSLIFWITFLKISSGPILLIF